MNKKGVCRTAAATIGLLTSTAWITGQSIEYACLIQFLQIFFGHLNFFVVVVLYILVKSFCSSSYSLSDLFGI